MTQDSLVHPLHSRHVVFLMLKMLWCIIGGHYACLKIKMVLLSRTYHFRKKSELQRIDYRWARVWGNGRAGTRTSTNSCLSQASVEDLLCMGHCSRSRGNNSKWNNVPARVSILAGRGRQTVPWQVVEKVRELRWAGQGVLYNESQLGQRNYLPKVTGAEWPEGGEGLSHANSRGKKILDRGNSKQRPWGRRKQAGWERGAHPTGRAPGPLQGGWISQGDAKFGPGEGNNLTLFQRSTVTGVDVGW